MAPAPVRSAGDDDLPVVAPAADLGCQTARDEVRMPSRGHDERTIGADTRYVHIHFLVSCGRAGPVAPSGACNGLVVTVLKPVCDGITHHQQISYQTFFVFVSGLYGVKCIC